MKRALGLIAALLLVPMLVRLLMAQTPSAPPPPPTFTLTDLGPVQNAAPGGVTALNASGEATGIKLDATNSYQRAFLYQNGTVTDLGSLPGGNLSYGYGINNSGQVAGVAQLSAASAGNTLRAVIWENGAITSLDPSAANSGFYSGAFGVNSGGDVAGYMNSGADLPVIWKGGTASGAVFLTTLPGAISASGRALAINDAGQAAGISFAADRLNHPVMWDASGNVTDLGTLGSQSFNQANAINKSGQVVGYSQLPLASGTTIVHAFLYQNGTLQDIGVAPGLNPGGTADADSSAWGINSNGDIVGISAPGASPVLGPGGGTGGRAFFYTAGTMYDLTSLLATGSGTGWQLENAYAINDSRQIVGVGVAPDHTEHGYLLTLALVPTTTTVAAFPSTSVFGQQVSFTVNVMPNSSALTPSGNVTIYDGTTSLGTVTLASGMATFNTSALSVGSHSITAVYSGDTNFATSTSTPAVLTVNQGATTSSVSAFPNPGTVGQSVTLSATVTPVAPAAGTPTGTVTFLDGATSLGTGTLSGGQATLATSSLTLSTHSITVMYAGDPNFAGSTSSAVSLAMQQATTTTLIVAPSPANAGQLVTLSATVASTPGVPTGETITFLDGAAVLGTGTISAGGMATFTTASLAVGNHNLSASYPGDANFAPSTSGTVPLMVVLPPVVITDNETVTVTDTESFPDVFDPETVNVTDAAWITPLINVAAPVISFSAGGLGFSNVTAGQTGTQPLTLSDIGQAPLLVSSAALTPGSAFSISQISCSNGAASLPTTLPVGGACLLMISYLAPSGPASSDVLTFTDNAALSNLPSLPAGSSYTQSIPLTGSGVDTPPPPPPPAVVPITDNETVTVTDTESFPDVSDAETVHVTDQASIQVISPTTTSISAPGVAFGTPAAATVSVSSAFAAVSGNVMLSIDGGAATTLPLSSGSAVFSLGLLATGTHALSASFPAQGNFFASSATGSIFVGQAPSITSANAATFVAGTAGSFTVITTGVPFPISMITSGTLPAGVTLVDNGNGTATLAGTPPLGATGVFPLTITAGNGVGVPAVQNFTLTVNQPPSITSGNTTTFTEGASGSFTVTAAGFPIPAISESPALPVGLALVDNGDGTASLSGTPAAGTQGSYAITIAATNGVAPDAAQSFTLNINLGPAITSGSSATFTEQMSGSFLVMTLAFPVPVLTETGALPSGVTFTDNHDGTATLGGTPAVGTSNNYPITISASNTVGAPTTQAFTLTVNATASISSGSTTTLTVGSTQFFTVTTSGSPAPALTFTGTLPAGVTFTDNGNGTATLGGTPAAGTANSYPLIITATNGIGSPAIQNFTLAVNQGAAILTGNGTTFTVGVPGPSFTVMTSGFPTPSIVEAGSLPAGVTFVDNGDGTGTLSGTPAANTGGTYPITFTANNGVDLPALQTFTLTINQGPAITSTNMATFNELVMGSFTVTSTGNPISALTEVGNLPNGVTFNDNGDGTAFLGGVPASGTGGQYGFTITAANGVLPSATQTFTLTVVPGLTFTSPNTATFNEGAQNSFTITTSGAPPPTVTIHGTLPSWLTFTPSGNGTATMTGTPPAGSEGVYIFTITALNGTGASATQDFVLTVVLPSGETGPAITSVNHATFALGLLAGDGLTHPYNFFKVTTTGFPVPALTAKFVSTNGLGGGGTVPYFHDNHDGTATIAFAPGAGGTQRFTITATGPSGLTATQVFTLQIATLGPIPKFTSANQVGFTVGVPGSFTVAAGPFVDQITASSLPVGITLTDNHDGTATLHGTPGGTSGTASKTTLTLTASNTSVNTAVHAKPYTANQTFTLVILPPGESGPAITSVNHATFAFGLLAGDGLTHPYNFFKVTTTGFPVPALTAKFVTTIGLGGGGAVPYFHDNHDGTASIVFAPTVVGTQRFTITATGPSGLAATQLFTLQIAFLGPLPKFTSANQVGFTAGVPGSFTVAAGPFVDQITASSLPAGIFLTDNHDGTATLKFQVLPGTTQPSKTIFTFTASNTNVNTAVHAKPYTANQTFTLVILPSGETGPAITSVNHATFGFGLLAGDGLTHPYNFFKVTTTGFPVPALTAKFVSTRLGGGGTPPVPYFHDNHDGTATIAFAPTVVGTQRFTITATGPSGLTVTQVFTLQIAFLGPIPKFTSANQVGFTIRVPGSFTVAAGPFVDQITTSGLPGGGITLTDNHDGTATLKLQVLPGTTPPSETIFTFTASNTNVNTAVHAKPYTANQTFTLVILP